MTVYRTLLRGMLAALLASGAIVAEAQTDITVKLRVASTLARFVEYADARERGGPLRFCVLSGRPLSQATIELVQKSGGLAVIELGPDATKPSCDVLYVDASAVRWKPVLEQVRSASLTVGDVSGFLEAGGSVELIQVDDNVRFDVNLAELRRQKIRMAAQALKLARKVVE